MDKCNELFARRLWPNVTHQWENVDQAAFLGHPCYLEKLISDWPHTIHVQPFLVAVVIEMQLHAYALHLQM